MIRFIPAEELKNRYDVFGHFYSVEFSRNKFVECRSVLEIIEHAQFDFCSFQSAENWSAEIA